MWRGKPFKPRISIHAPRVGCDELPGHVARGGNHFNPRTPCGVRRRPLDVHQLRCDFNPRTPCGVRLLPSPSPRQLQEISIHAPRVGCDWFAQFRAIAGGLFQSTHPVWGATRKPDHHGRQGTNFNPRTPCGVRPWTCAGNYRPRSYFNPRTPCGVRPMS